MLETLSSKFTFPKKKETSTSYINLLNEHKPSSYRSHTGHKLSYFHIKNINKPILVICPGYSEPAAKYLTLLKELSPLFEIYIVDHRGQGLSDRLTLFKHVSSLENFDNFIDDLETFTQKFIRPQNRKSFLLAHSMGGLIAVKYLMKNIETPYSGAVLSAPMFGIKLSAVSKFFLPFILKLATFFNILNSPIWGKGENAGYGTFRGNTVTSSRRRWQAYKDLLLLRPSMGLNGMSWKWLKRNIEAIEAFVPSQIEILIPTLILQAENEDVVINDNQDEFCFAQKNCKLKVIKKSKHELLFEAKPIRKQVVDYLLEFYSKL